MAASNENRKMINLFPTKSSYLLLSIQMVSLTLVATLLILGQPASAQSL